MRTPVAGFEAVNVSDRINGPTMKESFSVTRLTVRVPDVRGFQRNYEAAVPEVPNERMSALLKEGAPWSEMVELVDASAPHGFLIYEAHDVHPLMQAAGDDADCLFYLMGNHIVAERMFRHDPRTMLYAPLRTVIFEDSTGAAWFSVDQPSTHFASLGIPEVTEVGIELDRKLAALLQALDIEVPEPLLELTAEPLPGEGLAIAARPSPSNRTDLAMRRVHGPLSMSTAHL